MARRKSTGTRQRFEILKRDDFTCRYCGQKSPDVILEVDHIVPKAEGGSDDPINLGASCRGCNSGKSDRPLSSVSTGEDAYEKAVELFEKERQLREYERLRGAIEERRARDLTRLVDGVTFTIDSDMLPYIRTALKDFSVYDVTDAVQTAFERTRGWQPQATRYFCGIVRNWRENGGPSASHQKKVECQGCGSECLATIPEGALVYCSAACRGIDIATEIKLSKLEERGE